MLQIKNVNLNVGNTALLSNINLTLEQGKIYGVLGPNGAGKTTLFKSMLGLTAFSGEILSDGQPVSSRCFGSLIEYPAFYPRLTVEENLKLHAQYLGLKRPNIEVALKQVNLLDARKKLFSQLSLGMRQRLGIARAFLGDVQYLLLDEPTNGLDPMGIKEIRLLLKERLKSPQHCILVSSHNLTEIAAVTDVLIFIRDGKIIKIVENDYNEKELEALYEDIMTSGRGGSIMGVLIKNEFYKLKREWFMVFLLLLSLLPIITGGAGAIFNSSTTSLADLFFFMNNQFSMFFPMVLFILIGSLFYQEYKNKTYINWITYGFSKKKLFLSKVTVSVVIRHLFCGCLIYRIWPIGGDTQWSWQVDRRYFPVPQAGNRVWN